MEKEKKSVLFLIQGRDVAASRYRVLQYIPWLIRDQVETEVADFARKVSQWPGVLKKARKRDVLFIQRKQLGVFGGIALKKFSRKIVYDFDDALWVKSAKHRNNQSLSRRITFKRMVKLADEVITGNTFLAEKALKYNTHVTVIPTPIDVSKYEVRPARFDTNTVVIGWIGAKGSIHYLERMMPVLEKVHALDARIRLKIICNVFPKSSSLPIDRVRWSASTEVPQLQTLDIGLMPLLEDEWSRGKCGLKILQYFAAGIPAVVTPVGINRDIVKDGINGFWARSEKEWIDRILLLASDPFLRRKMGLKAREIVEKKYSLNACFPILKKVLFE